MGRGSQRKDCWAVAALHAKHSAQERWRPWQGSTFPSHADISDACTKYISVEDREHILPLAKPGPVLRGGQDASLSS